MAIGNERREPVERRTGMVEALTELGRVEGRLVTKVEALSDEVGGLSSQVTALDAKLTGHMADEEGIAGVVADLRNEVREADDATHQLLVDGHRAIIERLDAGAERMDAMQAELSRNTEVTEAVRDQRTFRKVLTEKWKVFSFWIASIGAVLYGLWQAFTVWVKGVGGGG
jgi:chromosome segregation ATPase